MSQLSDVNRRLLDLEEKNRKLELVEKDLRLKLESQSADLDGLKAKGELEVEVIRQKADIDSL